MKFNLTDEELEHINKIQEDVEVFLNELGRVSK